MLREQLEKAANEFLLEGYEYQGAEKMLESTPEEHRARAIKDLLPPRTMPDGCFRWLHYIVWLDAILEITPNVSLSAGDVEGLLVFRRARNKFIYEHPPCSHCGMPNEKTATRCRACVGEINH